MADPRLIGDILCDRRRSLGLSIDRVVEDTKLQRRMVEAFEDSDFNAMPPKGYAQASLASYARYLGLNPNEILRVYDDQLYEYQQQTSAGARRSGRERTASHPATVDDRASSRARRRQDDEEAYSRRHPVAREDSNRDDRRRSPRAPSDRMGREYPGMPEPYDHHEPSGERRGRSERTDRTGAPHGYDDYGYSRPTTGSIRDRGLYDSGYRSSRRDASERDRRYESVRDEYRGARTQFYPDDRSDDSRRESGRDRRERSRQTMQVVSLDDGYQGGSGGEPYDDRYRPRTPEAQRQSLNEVLWGVWASLRSDRKTFALIMFAIAATLLVVLSVGVSSCVRSSTTSQSGTNTIPVTPVNMQQTQLAQSVDLSAIPADSILSLTKDAQSASQTWVEVWVDGIADYAYIFAPGENLQWTVNGSVTVKLSNLDGVTVLVNGTPVTPALENGTYVLTMSVAVPTEDGTAVE